MERKGPPHEGAVSKHLLLNCYCSIRTDYFAKCTIISPLASFGNAIPLSFCSSIIECRKFGTITKSRPTYCFYTNRDGNTFQSLVRKC